MKRILLASAIALGVAAPAAAGPDALGCFARTYDRAHLAQHPDQLITAVKLRIYVPPSPSLSGYHWFTARFKLRGRSKTLHAEGVCHHEASGLRCNVECDGGGVDLTPRADGATMRLDRIRVITCDKIDDMESGEELTGGKDDGALQSLLSDVLTATEGRGRLLDFAGNPLRVALG